MQPDLYPEYAVPIGAAVSEGPCPFLSWLELACWDRTVTPHLFIAHYPDDYRGERLNRLVKCFLWIRHAAGDHPIRVSSAYRTFAYNDLVGGAEWSQHVFGRALDLVPPDGLALRAFYDICRAAAEVTAIRGLGYYDAAGFVHIDTRPRVDLVTWTGDRPKPEAIRV